MVTDQIPLVIKKRIIELQGTETIAAVQFRDGVLGGDVLSTRGVVSLVDGLVGQVADWQLNLFVMNDRPLVTTQNLLLLCMHHLQHGHLIMINAGCHPPVTIKFTDFSLSLSSPQTFQLNIYGVKSKLKLGYITTTRTPQSIDPRNSGDTKRNACYFSLQYSYILSQLRQLCSSVDSNNIRR